MIRPNDLEGKTRDELVSILAHLGKKAHHKAGEALLKDQIMQLAKQNNQPAQDLKHQAERPQAPVFHNTEEDILALIKPHMKEGFEAIFPGDGTWIFKYKGCEESGNMSIPPRIIKMKADFVSRGARRLMSYGRADNDPTYSGIILSA